MIIPTTWPVLRTVTNGPDPCHIFDEYSTRDLRRAVGAYSVFLPQMNGKMPVDTIKNVFSREPRLIFYETGV